MMMKEMFEQLGQNNLIMQNADIHLKNKSLQSKYLKGNFFFIESNSIIFYKL